MHASVSTPLHWPVHVPSRIPAQACRFPCGAPVTGTQAPTWPVASQASHSPAHVEAQQTPSTQKPLAQSVLAPHAPASGRFLRQTPAAQWSPAGQSAAPEHPWHWVCPHATGAHDCCLGAGHVPVPSQEAGSVAVLDALSQLALRHGTVEPG